MNNSTKVDARRDLTKYHSWVPRAMHGVRPASTGEREACCEPGPVRALRGRGQPRLWIRTRPGPLQAITVRDVAVPASTVSALLRGRLGPAQFAAAVVRILAERSACAGVAVCLADSEVARQTAPSASDTSQGS